MSLQQDDKKPGYEKIVKTKYNKTFISLYFFALVKTQNVMWPILCCKNYMYVTKYIKSFMYDRALQWCIS